MRYQVVIVKTSWQLKYLAEVSGSIGGVIYGYHEHARQRYVVGERLFYTASGYERIKGYGGEYALFVWWGMRGNGVLQMTRKWKSPAPRYSRVVSVRVHCVFAGGKPSCYTTLPLSIFCLVRFLCCIVPSTGYLLPSLLCTWDLFSEKRHGLIKYERFQSSTNSSRGGSEPPQPCSLATEPQLVHWSHVQGYITCSIRVASSSHHVSINAPPFYHNKSKMGLLRYLGVFGTAAVLF